MRIKLLDQIIYMSKIALYSVVIQAMLASVLMATSAEGQTKSIEKIYLSVKFEETKLEEIFKEIEERTAFKFAFNETLINLQEKITVHVNNNSLGEVLRVLSKESHLKFRRVGSDIFVSNTESNKPEVSEKLLSIDSLEGREISGRVNSADSPSGLPGVNILIKGTTRGTVSDINGNYKLQINDGDVLSFTYIGYMTHEVAVGDQSVIDVNLIIDAENLEEIVVIGYGTVLKSDVTGSVASVSSEELTAYPASGITQALQGRAPGLSVQSNNGDPGGSYKVRIRGGTSINASSDPLFVVDGFPTGSAPPAEDIESIEILKDASATAIYGSRGANGVIMITTKRGKSGETKVNFSSSYSVQSEINNLDLLNGQEFAEYINTFEASFGRPEPYADPASFRNGTDWQDAILQQGSIENYNVSVSGGNDHVKYYASGIYYNHKGIIKNSDYQRYSITSNLDIKASDRVNVGLNLFVRRIGQGAVKTQETSGGIQNLGVIGSAYKFEPIQGIYDVNGDFTTSTIGDPQDNPFALATQRQSDTQEDRVQPNIYAEVEIFDGLKFRTNFGTVISNERMGYYVPRTLLQGMGVNGLAELEFKRGTTLLNENYFTYSKKFGANHNFTVVGGYSYQSFTKEFSFSGSQTFVNDAGIYWNLRGGANPLIPSSALEESVLSSYYGRLMYSFKSKYLVTVTNRYDGSSRFAKNNKWAYFPSAALGWNMHKESFLSGIDAISELKLRASYGVTGNQAIDPYESLASLEDVLAVEQGNIVNAVAPATIANDDLTWESTTQIDVGVDLGLLGDRIVLNADYYRMVTSDLLFQIPLPLYSGTPNGYLGNAGEVENKGFELGINSVNIDGAFKWNMDVNISANRNKILSLSDTVDILYKNVPGATLSDDQQILRAGQPIGLFYGYVYEGVQQEGEEGLTYGEGVGGEKFRDIDEDKVLTAEDRTIIGDPNPNFIWGLNNTFTFKGIDLNIFFQGSQGNDIANYTRLELDGLVAKSNATSAVKRSWTAENPNTDVPAVKSRPARFSSRWIEDGSYIRLKSVALGYTFPSVVLEKIKLRSARFYISGQNLWTSTNYSGVDPEVGFRSSGAGDSNKNLGLDYMSYPMAKSYTIGLSIGF